MNFHRILPLPLRASPVRTPFSSRLPFRCASTTTPQSTSAQSSRWTRRLIYATLFGALGVSAGKLVDERVSAPPKPGSVEDQLALQEIQHFYETGLPIVQRLRNNPDWEESDAYGDFSEEKKAGRLSSGPLGGSRGLGLQKVFRNEKEQKIISVVFLGPGLEGWPTMVHGGALGTVIDESLGRAVIRRFPARTAVTANLNINYRAPVYSGNFYTFHTALDQEQSTDIKGYATCEVRDATGRVCVEVSGIFVVPKSFKLASIGNRF